MPKDTRPRYHVLQPIPKKRGRHFWIRVGTAYANTDGTIDAYLDMLVVDITSFRLRAFRPDECEENEPEPTDQERFS